MLPKKLGNRSETGGKLQRNVGRGQKKAGGQGPTSEDMVDLSHHMAEGRQNKKTSKQRQDTVRLIALGIYSNFQIERNAKEILPWNTWCMPVRH